MSKCKPGKACKGARTLSFIGDPDAVGLNLADAYNRETKVTTKQAQLYRFPRKSEHKGFVWLNFCPWCGVKQTRKA